MKAPRSLFAASAVLVAFGCASALAQQAHRFKAPDEPSVAVTVDQSTPMTGDDRMLADRVANAIHASGNFRKTSVRVSVNNGHVTLNGRVERDEQANLADSIATKIAGPGHVFNLLKADQG